MDLTNGDIRIRPGGEADVPALLAVVSDEEATRWWAASDHPDMVAVLLGEQADHYGSIVEVEGEVAGYIQFWEETDPKYRHAAIDIVLGSGFRDRGVGTTAIRLLARHLFDERGHHRLIIDPNAANTRAIRAYAKAGFQPVGIMRNYEWDHVMEEWTDGLLMEMLRRDLAEG